VASAAADRNPTVIPPSVQRQMSDAEQPSGCAYLLRPPAQGKADVEIHLDRYTGKLNEPDK